MSWTTRLLEARPAWVVTLVAVGVAMVGLIDFTTGAEIRVYPLYFLPLSVGAWRFGRTTAIGLSIVCALMWFATNRAAGMTYSSNLIWLVNVTVQATGFSIVSTLIAVIREAFAAAATQARVDPLTGIANSRAFFDEAERVLARARRHGNSTTVAYVDLDDFKAVNDTLGHRGGDLVLRQVATVLRQSTRAGDLAARVGGDEFALLLPDTERDGARALLERIRASLAEAQAGQARAVTVSIGAVTFATVPPSVEAMIQQADTHMYAAKAEGKNRVSVAERR